MVDLILGNACVRARIATPWHATQTADEQGPTGGNVIKSAEITRHPPALDRCIGSFCPRGNRKSMMRKEEK